jgi:hypothetical protein
MSYKETVKLMLDRGLIKKQKIGEIIGTDTYFFEIKIVKKNISFGKHVKL